MVKMYNVLIKMVYSIDKIHNKIYVITKEKAIVIKIIKEGNV